MRFIDTTPTEQILRAHGARLAAIEARLGIVLELECIFCAGKGERSAIGKKADDRLMIPCEFCGGTGMQPGTQK